MHDLLTYGVELIVGVACLVGGAGFWRKGSRVIAAILFVAGGAACIHALIAWIS